MPVNTTATFASDVRLAIAEDLLPLSQNYLVVYQLGEPCEIPKGHGNTLTKIRYNRIPLPFAPLLEAVPQNSSPMAISAVTMATQQWGGSLELSDLSTYRVAHDVVSKARELIAIQAAEVMERNTFNTLMGFTQINTVNGVGSVFALNANDTLGIYDLTRAEVQLRNLGAYQWMGNEEVNPKLDPHQDSDAKSRKMPSPHYILVCHDFVAGDLRTQSTFVQAASYSDINKLYNNEAGQWSGCRVVSTNFVPYFTGQAAISGSPLSSGGTLAGPTYYIIVTLSDPMRQYETIISQVSGAISVTGPNGAVSVILPSSSYTYNVYIGTSTSPVNLGTCVAGPTSGPYQGMATQLAGGQTVTITGIGTPQVPPAPVATGVTVYPSWLIAKYAYSQIKLKDIEINYLGQADKSDRYNQRRVVTWLADFGTGLDNNTYAIRIMSSSQFFTTYS
jgi:N4-gp56 family major capsid protein